VLTWASFAWTIQTFSSSSRGKDKTNEITNFNISVAITDKFMEALKSGTKYDLVNPRDHQIAGQLDAREVLDKIAFQAWKNGEPGLFFIDENNRRQPTPNVADMEATNPWCDRRNARFDGTGLIPIGELADRYPNGGISLITDRRVPAEVVTESNACCSRAVTRRPAVRGSADGGRMADGGQAGSGESRRNPGSIDGDRGSQSADDRRMGSGGGSGSGIPQGARSIG